MNLIKFLAFLATTLQLLHSIQAKEDVDNDISISDGLSSTTPNNLDSNLRKALLRALTELENEQTVKDNDDDIAAKTIFFSSTSRTPEDHIVEKAPASAISIVAKAETKVDNLNRQETSENEHKDEEEDGEEKTEKPLVIIQKSNGVEHRPIISVLNERNEETNEALSLSASSSFAENSNDFQTSKNFVRSSPKPNLGPNAVSVNDKSFTPGVKSVSITPKYDGTTTTQRPTTSTEENEAKVEDVQFFSAPLVAAFTVHQDERGLPNKVEPIFKQAGQSSVSTSEIVDKERKELLRQEEIQREQYRQQLAAQAKQKALEQQVQSLQDQQKKQQEYLLRQQRIIQEQQLQHQRLVQEQQRLQHNDRPFVPIINNSPSTTERPVFFTTTNSGNNFNTFQKLPEATSGNFNKFPSTFQHSTPNPLSIAGSNSVKPNAPSFLQELPATTPSPHIFNQNIKQTPFNFNQGVTNNNHFNGFDQPFNNFNNVNSNFNNFNNNFNNLNAPASNNKFNNNNKFQNTLVSLQSSVGFTPTELQAGKLPLNAQILPVRNAIDFLQSPNPNPNVNFRPPTLLSQQQQQQPFQNPNTFQQFPNNFVQNLPNIRQSTRVFRQESSTGNFGFNNFNKNLQPSTFNDFKQPPTFSIQQSLEPPSRFFRSNSETFHQHPAFANKNVFPPQNVNQQLNSLLYHSGIARNVRQNDDLQIVSKILSYNLGRDNLFSGSQRVPKRLN